MGAPKAAGAEERIDWSVTRGPANARCLVLLIHGLDASREALAGVADAIEETVGDCHILRPRLPLQWHACGDLKELARAMVRRLEALDASRYESVYLVGHSAGGVLAQAVYLLSRDPAEGSTLDLQSPRLVLIAPLNRGWALSHHLPLGKKLAWMVGLSVLPLSRLAELAKSAFQRRAPRPLWLGQLRRGSPFLVWMQLAWLRLYRDHDNDPAEPIPEVVQLLGSVDELVSWNDMVDAVTGQDFVYFEVPYSDHVAIIDYEDPLHGSARRAIFQSALGAYAHARAAEWAILPWDSDPIPPEPLVRRVVFVIHGIRDEGHWTQKIASRARRMYVQEDRRRRDEIAVVTSRYGYFSMLQFLIYPQRRAKVNWLIEQYVEARRRYPKAQFSYVGHSNGTYLAAHALERFPDVRFERVAFAGSVVSSRFDWRRLYPQQVTYVLNYAATADWVVGIFPRIADLVPPTKVLLGPSLGGAGIEPFQEEPFVQTLEYRVGQHGAAIQEENWDDLARFAVAEGDEFAFPVARPEPDDPRFESKRSLLFRPALGWITSIASWMLLLWLVAWLLPGVAWREPAGFWSVLFALVIVTCGAFALADQRVRDLPPHGRKRVYVRALLVLMALGLTALVALCAVTPLFSWLCEISAGVGDGWRTASVLVYCLGLYLALTRI